MLKFKQVISAVAVVFFVNSAVQAHQPNGHHGPAIDHAEIQFVHAEVVEVDTDHNELVLRHEAIEHLDMAAMTMAFSVADEVDISHLSDGDEIKVKVDRQGRGFVIIEMDANQLHH